MPATGRNAEVPGGEPGGDAYEDDCSYTQGLVHRADIHRKPTTILKRRESDVALARMLVRKAV
jgi:hypothetical protein